MHAGWIENDEVALVGADFDAVLHANTEESIRSLY